MRTVASRVIAVSVAAVAVIAPVTATADPVSPTEARASQWYLDPLGITAAQQVTTGEGVFVCLIDGGTVPTLPDLAGAHIEAGTDLTGRGSPDGFTPVGDFEFELSHGTTMAALIGAQGVGGGFVGSAPGALIRPVSTYEGDQSDPAVKWCADQGASVISISLSFGVSREAIRYAQARDAVIVAGTGNSFSSESLATPAEYFGVLSVGGVGSDLLHDPMANFAPPVTELLAGDPAVSSDTQGVAVVGPSSLTSGADEAACVGYWAPSLDAEGYSNHCGTSRATAVVAGVVALVRAAHPDLNAANVINRILMTATKAADQDSVPADKYGWGIVNAEQAVTAEVPLVDGNPLGSYYTESMGLRNAEVKPVRAEPPVGATLPATDVMADITGEPWDTALPGDDGGTEAGGIPMWVYAAGGALVLVLLLVGLGLGLSKRRKGTAA